MAAELRLGVSFDLVYFRQQLGKLSQIAASEFAGKVKLNIDKRDFQRQLTSLTKELRINVNDSQITGAREKLGQLNQGIATLRRAVAAPIEIKIKYTEQGKPPVGFGGTAARAVSGRVAGTQIAEGASRAELQKIYGLFREANLRIGQLSNGLGRATADELREAIVPAFSDSGEEAINGLANGLKDGSSKVGKAAARIGEGTLRAIKDVLGIASPSREFRKIGQFSIDGLEAGFVDGLQGFKTKAVSEIKKIVALLKLELASVGSVNVGAGVTEARGRAIGGRQYMAPIGPLPLGSREPWSPGSRGMYGGSGFEPYMSTGGMARASVQGMPGIRSALTSASMVGVGRLALPPAGGSGGSREAALALRELEARARSAARAAAVFAEDAVQASRRRGLEVASGQVPLGGGGRFLPPGGGGGGGGGGGNQGRGVPFGFSMQGMPSSLPGQGLIREMGDEFGFAAKQVLLFGAAYKALAVVTNFPAQVTEAVSALQNFRNTLTAVTPSSEEFRASSDLILGLVEKYNIPLQSARDGFTRLYASMQPAGFGGEEIRELFTGISKAAATFGMSADKVDRVNYAFAQMASKGQVMSEELKGQLGDVLPGAMAIFAEAAGFEGPNAISEFSQALEDGAYKGEAMKALLTNVGTIMNKEFGPGAEGAARTFQGAMNRMQNSMKLLYETFEPVAVGFLNTVVTPFSNGIKTLTDGLNSFFTGAAAKTSGGFAIATELEKLRPTFDGIQKNAAQVGKQLLELAKVALEVGKVFLQIAGNPIVGYLARLYLIFLPLNTVLTIARGLWASNAIQLAIFNARIATGTSTLTAFRGMMAATGATAKTTGVAIRTAGVALRTFFAASGVGLVLVGLSMLIEKFMSMNQALADTRAKALGAAQAIRSMSQTEAVQEERKAQTGVRLIGKLRARGPSYAGGEHVGMSAQEGQQLRDLGIPVERTISGGFRAPVAMLDAYQQRLETVNIAESQARRRQIEFEDKQAQSPSQLAAIPESAGDGKAKRERQLRDFESEAIAQLRLNQKLAQERLDQQRQLEIIDETEYDIASASNKRKFELLIVEEALADKRAGIGDYEVGVRQKQLAVFEQLAANERQLVEEEYKTAVKGAQLKISRPFKEGIRNENIEIEKQALLLRNLRAGYSELTPEQEANLIIEEKVKDLRARQQELVKTEIENLRQVTLERIRGAQALQKEMELLKLRNQAVQLRAPLGQERLVELMQTPGYTPEEAQQQFNLEEQNRRLQVFRQGASDLAGTINSSIGDAITNIVTDFQNLQQHGMTFLQTLANGFKQLANTIIQEMTRAMISKAVSQLLGFIMPGGGKAGPDLTAGIRQYAYANGGIAPGGFQAFAAGGLVTGPTLGLVGEGRFNEAVVPLPNGKSIPVDLGGGAGNNISTNIVVNMNNGQASSQSSGRGGQALGREIEGAVRNVILKETRPGGLIYSGR